MSSKGTILFGGSGFLGSNILRLRPDFISVGRTPPPTGNRHVPIASVGDLSCLASLEFDQVIFVIGHSDHYGLDKEVLQPGEWNAFDYHTMPLIQALEQLKQRPIRKFIHFSTVLLYDELRIKLPASESEPINPYRNRYLMSKYLAEEVSKYYARWMPVATVRLANMYGPWPRKRYDLIHTLCWSLLANGRASMWTAKPQRDFIYVEDAAAAVVQLLDSDAAGTFNLGSGIATPVSEVRDILAEVSGCPIDVLDRQVNGPLRFWCDIGALKSAIRWQPQWSIREGIRRTFEIMGSYNQ